jgi:3-mercaptopyruvate sulfurtransferase SseA
MPSSISVAFNEVVDAQTGTMLDDEALHKVFVEQKGVDLSKPIITSCGKEQRKGPMM